MILGLSTEAISLLHVLISWSEAPSREAVAAPRQLYHRAVERRDRYTGCRPAFEPAEMLALIGEIEAADALYFHIVKLGATAGLYQVFLEKAGETDAPLRRALERTRSARATDPEVLPFVRSLLSRRETRRGGIAPHHLSRALSDTLSARERDILDRISRGFSNKLIARGLDISPETVKTHVKRIFIKLGVSTRAEAVSRGQSLGLL